MLLLWKLFCQCIASCVCLCIAMAHYVSLCIAMAHYVSLCIAMAYYVSLCIAMAHYVSLCIAMAHYVCLCIASCACLSLHLQVVYVSTLQCVCQVILGYIKLCLLPHNQDQLILAVISEYDMERVRNGNVHISIISIVTSNSRLMLN